MKQGLKLGGVNTAARIMNLVKVDEMDSVLGDLTSLDQELAQRVIDAMIRFDELAEADSRSLQTLVRNLDASTLMVALVGVQRPVRDAFLKSMSCRARGDFLMIWIIWVPFDAVTSRLRVRKLFASPEGYATKIALRCPLWATSIRR